MSTTELQDKVREAIDAEPASATDVAATAIGAAVDASAPSDKMEVAKGAAAAAVSAAPPGAEKDVAAGALDALSPDKRKELIESVWPQVSGHRLAIYQTGFIVAGAVVIALSLIAWGASGSANSVSTAVIVLATGFASAILGGLLGAYIQR